MSDHPNGDYVDEASGTRTIRSKNTYSGVCHSNPQTYGGGEIHLPERQASSNGQPKVQVATTRQHFINACNAITSREDADKYIVALRRRRDRLPMEDELMPCAPSPAQSFMPPPQTVGQGANSVLGKSWLVTGHRP